MNILAELLDDFISLLLPRLCHGCGNHLLRSEKIICTECYVLIPRTGFHIQPDNPVEQLFWGRCRVEKAATFSFYTRGSRMRKLIHDMKYKGIREIGNELGRIYGLSLAASEFLKGTDLIIPVPLHKQRMKERGFNQSELIAAGISSVTAIPVDCMSLERIVVTSTQTRRSRYDRWENVEGIFRVSRPEVVRDKHILLVDDVITTGSTIEACVNEILKVDGTRVSVAALAWSVI